MTRVKRVESACAYFHACTRRAHEVGDVPVTSSTEAIGDRGKDKLGQMMQDAVIRATARPEPGVVGFFGLYVPGNSRARCLCRSKNNAC